MNTVSLLTFSSVQHLRLRVHLSILFHTKQMQNDHVCFQRSQRDNTTPCLPDAVIDLTMISTAEVTQVNHFTISCINGERSPAAVELDIKRDNEILKFPKMPNFKVNRQRTKEAVASEFRDLDNIGIFYCESTQEDLPLEAVTMINNIGRGAYTLLVHFSAEFPS